MVCPPHIHYFLAVAFPTLSKKREREGAARSLLY